ncbi:MAG: MerR family transcriptional regulator [Ruminiclostridium sp.]|nr:MerR family transcriptional regulator [Ruminiclostridium sp.]
MTIKEMEARTGLTRANIRFYEAEGLITPERRPNGYRDYSEEDLAVLQRVKLLRSLHMSLEEIKAVQAGDRTLSQALDRHLTKLERDQADLERSKVVCRGMQTDGADFATLDAPRYLQKLEQTGQDPPAEFAADQLPRVQAPWRRYFARMFDFFLYTSLLNLVLVLLGVNISGSGAGLSVLTLVAATLMMLLLEPLFLSRWGTTPGKAILGLSVTYLNGSRLTYSEAFRRIQPVLLRGMGLNVPIYEWVRWYKCYLDCTEGKPLPWEGESVLVLQDTKLWRPAALAAVWVAVVLGLSGVSLAMAPPHNTGDITVAEFCENFNDLADYHGFDLGYTLDDRGNWVEVPREDNVIVLWEEVSPSLPVFTFREEDGIMTGLTYTVEGTKGAVLITPYGEQTSLALMAFVPAQEGYRISLWSSPLDAVLDELSSAMPQVDERAFGVHITCVSDWDPSREDASLVFSMDKVG